ncbi:probable transcription factor GLK2 isoform X3 [Musa acuminata AAA Group]|uniref:probable transcription factor GLK2 isoform X3 n=1 Tax=Musa acuminata AAA Group TaxID=214697 RepID=UPI0031D14CB7
MGSTCHDPGNSLLPSATAGGESMMQRFPAPPPVPGIVPQPMYRPIPPPVTDHSSSQLQLDAHPVDRESLVSCVQEGFTSCLPHGLFVSRMVWNSNVAV